MATFNEYINDKVAFARKHNETDCKKFTSPMINNRYHSEMVWGDGAIWYEIVELITEDIELEAHGVKTFAPVKWWRTEYWTSESGSKYLYEKA